MKQAVRVMHPLGVARHLGADHARREPVVGSGRARVRWCARRGPRPSSAQVDGQSCGQADARSVSRPGEIRIGLFTAASPPMSGTESQQQILAAGLRGHSAASWRFSCSLFSWARSLERRPHPAHQQDQDRATSGRDQRGVVETLRAELRHQIASTAGSVAITSPTIQPKRPAPAIPGSGSVAART